MTTSDDPDGLIQWKASLPVRRLRENRFTHLIPLPEPTAALVGRVVVQWGMFEVLMNDAIAGFAQADPNVEPGWRTQSFRKRKNLFVDSAKAWFGEHKEPLQSVSNIAQLAARLHWKRNLVAHGHYVLCKTDDGDVFRATGTVKSKEVTLDLSVDFLEELWIDIAHLGGAMSVFMLSIGAALTNPMLLIDYTEILQGGSAGNLRSPPTLAAAKHPPRS